ncbi:MAG: VOC family protein, partial [Chloroflexi bacterium]|nr:VOC family protein [Chloroflexota bacterium]
MAKITPCLWFDGNAQEAADLYVSLLPDSHVDEVWRSPAETPSGPAGMVLTVDFTLAGQKFQGLNGGPEFSFN